MHLTHLRFRDFRNYVRLDVPLEPGFHLMLGKNAQGKTNLLEAIYLLATLRSFRGVGSPHLVRKGATGFFVGANLVGRTSHSIKLYWSPQKRQVTLDNAPIRRLADYFGVLRVVVFCSEDIQLVKGPARIRRRFLDLLLAHTQPPYLALLQRYMQSVRARNALLRQKTPDDAALDGFSREMVRLGQQVMEQRQRLLPQLSPIIQSAHQRISSGRETLSLHYQPSVQGDFAVELGRARARERALRMTCVGPHRDELIFRLNDLPAAQYGSEGQKRSLALALKLAQAEYLTHCHGVPPILLLDDVMGELDEERQSAFLPLLTTCQRERGQVFMTGTAETWPGDLGLHFHRWTIASGQLTAVRP